MPNVKPTEPTSVRGLASVAMTIVAFGLAACLGGGGGDPVSEGVVTASADPDAPIFVIPIVPGFPTPSPIPVLALPAAIVAVPGVTGVVRVNTNTTGMQVGDSVQISSSGGLYDGGVTPGAYDGIFTVTAMSPLVGGPGGSFDVAITFTTPSGASTQIVAGGTPPACVTTGATPADLAAFPVVGISASRYGGVAPLAVFFDTTGTTSTATSRPFHEVDYQWDFDDAGFDGAIGNWGTTTDGTGSSGTGVNTSRRTGSGPVAAHVYEKAGTYRVRLTVRDANGKSVTNNCIQIAVQDPVQVFATNTICISDTADASTGCPAGAAQLPNTTNFVAAMTTAIGAGKRRILFRRDGVFTANTFYRLIADGPGMVGAYGAGAAAPIIRLNYSGDLWQMGTPTFSDWRIVDLDLDLNNAGTASRALKATGNMADVLYQRLRIRNGYHGFTFSDDTATPPWDKIFITDSTFENLMSNPTNGQALFISASRLAYLGNRVNVTRSHNARFPFINKGVISHNHHNTPGAAQSTLKIHSTDFPTKGGHNERVIVSNNKFESGPAAWLFELKPQARHNDERFRDYIVERNLFRTLPGFSTEAMLVSGSNMTIRNNIFDVSNNSSGQGFRVERFGDCLPACEPNPDNIDIFHNTFYSSAAPFGSTMKLITIAATVTSGRVNNNLGYTPNLPAPPAPQTPRLIDNFAGGVVVGANNSTNNQLVAPTPNPFVSGAPVNPADFVLQGGSYAAGGGAVTVPVMRDMFGNIRPNPAASDIGASEVP